MTTLSNYSKFVSESFLDYPDNSSLSVIFYMPGCNRNCKGCQNSLLKEEVQYENIDKLIEFLRKKCERSQTNKLCLQGGDPLFNRNIAVTKRILDKLSNTLDICIYTGANIDEVKKANLHGFKYIKCGKFDESEFIGSQKTDDYMQFATKNQKLYDANLKLLSKDGIYNF